MRAFWGNSMKYRLSYGFGAVNPGAGFLWALVIASAYTGATADDGLLRVAIAPSIPEAEANAEGLTVIDLEKAKGLDDSDSIENEAEEDSDGTGDDELDALLDQDLDTLASAKVTTPDLNFEVDSVARTEKPIGKTPAAIYVITSEMIRRSPAINLPDLLRQVPGLHVSRLSNGQWIIGMRGSASFRSRELLVQVDGRSIYNRVFGGVFWELNDMSLENIERIEIIRGPGGSVWGANAVTGVINITTKCSCQTQGVYAEAGAGNEVDYTSTFRFGGETQLGTYRVWGKALQIDGGLNNGQDEAGNWGSNTFGLRFDTDKTFFDKLTIDSGFIDAGALSERRDSLPTPPFTRLENEFNGANAFFVNVTGTYRLDDEQSIKTRASHHYRGLEGGYAFAGPLVQTEFDLQHTFAILGNHSFVWGTNFRHSAVLDGDTTGFRTGLPAMDLHEYGLFLQDTIAYSDDFEVTLGTKVSYNDFTQFEFQPTVRAVWNPSDKTSVWGAVSRAVQTPNFVQQNGFFLRQGPVRTVPLPTFTEVLSGSSESLDLLAFELGIRAQPTKSIYWDAAIYHFNLRNSLTVASGGAPRPGSVPGTLVIPLNLISGSGTEETTGGEFHGKWEVTDNWRLSGNYSYNYRADGSTLRFANNSLFLQSSHDLTQKLACDLIWRYRDNFFNVPSYNTADVRLSWRVCPQAEIALAGTNLINAPFTESLSSGFAGLTVTETQRSLLGTVRVYY